MNKEQEQQILDYYSTADKYIHSKLHSNTHQNVFTLSLIHIYIYISWRRFHDIFHQIFLYPYQHLILLVLFKYDLLQTFLIFLFFF